MPTNCTFINEQLMEGQDLLHVTLTGYILQSTFYSQNLHKGGAICS